MARVTAASPHQPLSLQPVSTERTSPSFSGLRLGMPWTTASFTLAQMTAGKAGLPLTEFG